MPHGCGCVVDNAAGYDSYSRWYRTSFFRHARAVRSLPRLGQYQGQTRTPPGMFPDGVQRVCPADPGDDPRNPQCAVELLDRDGGAGALKGSLRLLRGLLVDLLQDGLRRAVDQVLGLLQAQAGERAHLLDDLDLLVASGFKDDVELVLLLGLFRPGSGARTAGGRRDRDRGRRLDVEGLLERLHELGQLKEGHLLERVEQISAAELRHDRFPSFLSPEWVSRCRPLPPVRPRVPRPLCLPGCRPRAWRAARRRAA